MLSRELFRVLPFKIESYLQGWQTHFWQSCLPIPLRPSDRNAHLDRGHLTFQGNFKNTFIDDNLYLSYWSGYTPFAEIYTEQPNSLIWTVTTQMEWYDLIYILRGKLAMAACKANSIHTPFTPSPIYLYYSFLYVSYHHLQTYKILTKKYFSISNFLLVSNHICKVS